MNVVRATIDGMQMPLSMLTGFRDLPLDGNSLFCGEAAGILGHACHVFPFQNWIGELPTAPILDPSPTIARKPRSVGVPRQEERDRLGHD